MVARLFIALTLVPALATAFMGPLAPCRRPQFAVSRGFVQMADVQEKPRTTPLYSTSGKETSSALVPVNKQNIETSAALVGTGVGVVILGPLFGLAFGLISNYVAKTESDLGEAARGLGKTALEVFNYVAKINDKYALGEKITDAGKTAITKLKESETDTSVLEKVEETVSTTTSKLGELNQQYDLVGKAKSAVQLAVDLSGAAIDKAIELNEKYSLVEKTGEAVKTAAAKVKEAVDKQQ